MDEIEEIPKPILRKRKPQNRKTKIVLMFDEAARKEYLTGFHKRKNERRKKAKEENKKKEKEERSALKQKIREMIHRSDQRRIPELEQLMDSDVYDLPEHTVTITDVFECNRSDAGMTPETNHQDSSTKNKTEEDITTIRRKQKKLMHKLAKSGNMLSHKRKGKRLSQGKLKGGGNKKAKFQYRRQRKEGKKASNQQSGKRKQRHK